MPTLNAVEWNDFLTHFPQVHVLQTAAWGELKSAFGWQPERVRVGNAGAQILFRHLPLGFSVAYIPKGPLGDDWAALWPEVDQLCRRRRAIFLKVEPDLWEPVRADLSSAFPGFQAGAPTIQPRRTAVIDLRGTEEDWLARMRQKTRYNIHLAERKDVQVGPSEDLAAFHALMQVTGSRDGFGVHSLSYYQRAYELFAAQGQCALLAARYAGQPLAMLMVFAVGERAWYVYGASSDVERNRMPTYLLQWAAMRWARDRGCTSYDLWGLPDEDEDVLEANFTERSDGLWGVYRFKRGFGGQVMRAAAAWEKVYQPLLYQLYVWRTGKGPAGMGG